MSALGAQRPLASFLGAGDLSQTVCPQVSLWQWDAWVLIHQAAEGPRIDSAQAARGAVLVQGG